MKEIDRMMYFRAKPGTFETARILRKNMTYSEKVLWEKLKRKL
jgi:very-short-patch-repair endonuclease